MTADNDMSGMSALSAKQMHALFGAALVPVITTDSLGDEHIGSAFHVGDGVFVTAKHVIDGQTYCAVQVDGYRNWQLAAELTELWASRDDRLIEIKAFGHPEAGKDVAVFRCPDLSALPTIPLGDHLDDWIADNDFILNEVLVLGFPPIPLAQRNVLVAARGQINAVVDLINVNHVHFVVSAMARGGFSGGVVLSEWGFALGVITSSLTKNGAVEELGYLTVLTVEPILECLAMNGMLPGALAAQWDGLFTSKTLYFGRSSDSWAHSWIDSDRDGWRGRISYNTPDARVRSRMDDILRGAGFVEDPPKGRERRWMFGGAYDASNEAISLTVDELTDIMAAEGYDLVNRPATVEQTLDRENTRRGRIASDDR